MRRGLVIVGAFLLFSIGGGEREVKAGGFTGATEWTQLANNMELVEIASQTIESVAQQMQQLQLAIQQAKTLDLTLLSPLFDNVKAISDVIQAGQGLAYSMENLDSEWNVRFHDSGYADTRNYPALYDSWAKNSLNSFKNVMKTVGKMEHSLTDENAVIAKLKDRAQSHQGGAVEVAQLTADITMQLVGEMHQLRQLMLEDVEAKQGWQLQQQQDQQSGHDMIQTDKLFTTDPMNLPYDPLEVGISDPTLDYYRSKGALY